MTDSSVHEAASGSASTTIITPLHSAVWQTVAIAAATIVAGALHWQNDGLWFQGDAPRHAANGLFFWDLLTSLPADPLGYTLSYYARFPVIAPVAYPPLFYLLEGVAFRIVGPSPYVAKVLVLACAGMVGIYTMMWGRRWIAPLAGWSGACVVLLPAFVQYSNAVLLNVPATALGLAVLYHFRIWQETDNARHATLIAGLAVAMILTYYPGAVVLPIGVMWMLYSGRRARGLSFWLIPAIVVLLALAIAALLPTYVARHAPSMTRWLRVDSWMFYVRALVQLTSLPWLVLGGAGLVAGLATRGLQRESVRLMLAYASVIGCLALLPARDGRYALMLAPMTALAAFLGIAAYVDATGQARSGAAAAVVFALALAGWSALRTTVPIVSGIDQVATYLRSHGAGDTVLYSGQNDGVFGFYARAFDPGFQRRVILSSKLLYRSEERVDFTRGETAYATSPTDVVSMIQRQCGCRWVAVEIGPEWMIPASERLLRRAVDGPEFERVQSFPVTAGPVVRVDLYRLLIPFAPAPPVELAFPSFSARVFRGIEPIGRRR